MTYQQSAGMSDTYVQRPTPAMYGQPAAQGRVQQDGQPNGNGYPQVTVSGAQGDISMATLTDQFAQLNVSGTTMSPPAANISVGHGQLPVNGNHMYYYTQDNRVLYAPPTEVYAPQHTDHNYQGFQSHMPFLAQGAYPGYGPGYAIVPIGAPRSFSSERPDLMHKEVPGLDNRRGSYSTIDTAPGTPYYGAVNQRDGTHIAIVDRSPIYSTPSPQQLPPTGVPHQVIKPLPYKSSVSDGELDALVQQQPVIPRAVPAVFTPREHMRTLEQSLSNPILGNRNVYVRGLLPTINDEMLAGFASRFGRVETSKAIIDTSTGACKGFGFAKYFDVRHAELAIRGFFRLGYEVGFARESFNSRLKAEGDTNSTNLYVSNLPRDFTENELGAIFMDYTVKSSKILRDDTGKSRGVGFARFESRDVCEEIIKKFHGRAIGDEGLLLQVRYADTPAQKDLKRITSERRQFRTNEYNVGAYGKPIDVSMASSLSPTAVPRMTQIVRHIPQEIVNIAPWVKTYATPPNGDINRQMTRAPRNSISPIKSNTHHNSVRTPEVSEDGSEDEGATIRCQSPAITISPSAHKT